MTSLCVFTWIAFLLVMISLCKGEPSSHHGSSVSRSIGGGAESLLVRLLAELGHTDSTADTYNNSSLETQLMDVRATSRHCQPEWLYQEYYPYRSSMSRPLQQPGTCGQRNQDRSQTTSQTRSQGGRVARNVIASQSEGQMTRIGSRVSRNQDVKQSEQDKEIIRLISKVLGVNESGATKGVKREGKEEGQQAEARIVGGTESQVNEWPWLVGIGLHSRGEDAWHSCGGTLITHSWVVTAAHCFNAYGKICDYKFRVGEHNLFDTTETSHTDVDAREIFIHPDYDDSTSENDIALVKLRTSLTLNDEVNVACLPPSTQHPVPTSSQCYVAGWGLTAHEGQASDTVRHVDIPLLEQGPCNVQHGQLHEGMLCAGHMQGGKDSCQGDSGGPLMCRTSSGQYELTGVVSFGAECAGRNKPGVYTNIRHYLPWIRGTIYEYENGVVDKRP